MTIHEFGQVHDEVVVLVHPSVVMWDYFEYVIPLMQDRYHLIVPALPGYDTENSSDFTSVEEIAEELADWLIAHGHRSIACIYGCSMGGAVVTRFLADRKVKVSSAVIDGGITPYQLPWIVTRCICHMDKEYSQGFRHIRYDRNSAVSEGARACEYRLRFDSEKD